MRNVAKYVAAVLLAVQVSVVQAEVVNQILPGLPKDAPPETFVEVFYKWSLGVAAVLAFGAIVYGGFKYTLAAGNPSGQSEGKEWIKSALSGLLLLFAASLILNTINPEIFAGIRGLGS